jgi:uncharacterized membrane protein YbhN (UPF0104 family)
MDKSNSHFIFIYLLFYVLFLFLNKEFMNFFYVTLFLFIIFVFFIRFFQKKKKIVFTKLSFLSNLVTNKGGQIDELPR